MDASDMPQVNAEFGSMPVITFPSPEAPAQASRAGNNRGGRPCSP